MDAFPPQQVVRQTRDVLEPRRAAGGTVQEAVLAGSGHGPFLDAPEAFRALLLDVLDRA